MYCLHNAGKELTGIGVYLTSNFKKPKWYFHQKILGAHVLSKISGHTMHIICV